MTENLPYLSLEALSATEEELIPSQVVEQVNALESQFALLSNEALSQKTTEFRVLLAQVALAAEQDQVAEVQAQALDKILPAAFGVVRESAKRFIGLRHRDVQLLAGLAIHQGEVAEMKTGEGKTLASTLAVYLNSLALNPEWVQKAQVEWGDDPTNWQFETLDGTLVGNGIHVVTTNDYLARRDARLMARIYKSLGLSTGVLQDSAQDSEAQAAYLVDLNITSDKEKLDKLREVKRKSAYEADITYGTQNEFGFDYLRDHMCFDASNQVQRGHNFAVVDEPDEILIDQAVTPLIISGPSEQDVYFYHQVGESVKSLEEGSDFEVDQVGRQVHLSPVGEKHLGRILGVPFGNNYLKEQASPRELMLWGYVTQALRAEFAFKRGKDYLVLPDPVSGQDRVVIIDNFTGHLMTGRTWSDGLHQAIEAKEGLEVTGENATYASISIQSYFLMYQKLAGMTGTVMEAEGEFQSVYGMETAFIPTHLQYLAQQPGSRLIKKIAEDGQEFYVNPGKPEEVLFWERTDYQDVICPNEKSQAEVLLAEINECHHLGRPVLVGTTSVEQSEKLSKLLDDEGIEHQVLNARHHAQESQIIANAGRLKAVTIATNMAGRGVDVKLGGELSVEILIKINQLLRKLGVENPEELDELAQSEFLQKLSPAELVGFEVEVELFLQHFQAEEQVKQLGGLHIVGTQRHRSRRIDNQLRGRASRQGDPGSSRFILSMSNELTIAAQENNSQLREFLKKEVDTWSAEDLILAAELLDKSQRDAQEQDSLAREHLLEYSEVQSIHRNRIYEQIQRVLEKESLSLDILEIMTDEVGTQLEKLRRSQADPDLFFRWLETIQPIWETEKGVLPSFSMRTIAQELAPFAHNKTEFISQAFSLKEKFINAKKISVLKGLSKLLEMVQLNEADLNLLLGAISPSLPIELSLSVGDLVGLSKPKLASELAKEIKQVFDRQISQELGLEEDRVLKVAALAAGDLTKDQAIAVEEKSLSDLSQLELVRRIFFGEKENLDADYLGVLAKESLEPTSESTVFSLKQIFAKETPLKKQLQLAQELALNHLTQSLEFLAQQVPESDIFNGYLRETIVTSFSLGWMDYLTQMEKLRVGVGLEAYGQRDPLLVYKKEAAELFAKMMTKVRSAVMRQVFINFPNLVTTQKENS